MMKKLLIMCCILLGFAAVSRAQGGGQRRSPEDRAKQLQTALNLTDDQTAKITAIYQAQAKQVDSIRTAGGDFSAMRPLMQATNEKVKAILTPEQATAYQKMMDERRARMQQGGGGGN
ncbi:MAG: Spy/CpxP family protein refolding chaperone [Bacteroidetes bacterium]|nr:Spy/CpxP family protein refolding chaperone [Bacteroidota bacterium]